MTKRTCTIDGCGNPYVARGMCSKHYEVEKWAGRIPPRPTMSERFWAKVDKRGPDECWEWEAVRRGGYGRFSVKGRLREAHRVAYELTFGPIGDGMMIDHRCHNHPCCNPAHLREATHKQNSENRAGPTRLNRSSGVRGVHRSSKNRWVAEMNHNGERFRVGLFRTVAEAEAAVIAKRNELFTHNDRDRV